MHVDFKGGAQPFDDEEPAFTAEHPLEGEIAALINLNGTGSTRETWHVEIAADAPGFSYAPGDAIGVLPENDPALALELAEAVGLGADGGVVQKLRQSFDVTTLSRNLIEAYAKLTGRSDVAKLADPKAFAEFAVDRQLIDLIETYPEKLAPEQLFGLLRPLPGRLYSVASSPNAHSGEAHLLVGAVRWESHGRKRGGVASTYLADRCRVGDKVRIYVKPNRHFRLPEDSARPIVMIGAGTGVAPYRAFIEERVEQGAKGKSWLVFGERNYTFDFLYQLEWQEHLASGALSRIDVAFSRDQPEKIYVQQRLWEHRAELLKWIEDGTHIYVCGDEKGMGRDVDVMLDAHPRRGRAAATRKPGAQSSRSLPRPDAISATCIEPRERRFDRIERRWPPTSARRTSSSRRRAISCAAPSRRGSPTWPRAPSPRMTRSSPSSTAPTCRTTATCGTSARRRSWRRPTAS